MYLWNRISNRYAYSAPPAQDQIDGCHQDVRPWFEERSLCVVLELNCYHLDIDGIEHEVLGILNQVHIATLSAIQFTHCPNLHIPRSLQTFNQLLWLEIYNS